MADTAAHFLAPLCPYSGYIIGVAALAAVLLLNQLIYRHRWNSYPTLTQYLAAHPECNKAEGVVCDRCGTKVARVGVSGRGRIYRCTWCETELYRIDRERG
jgi:DNA-directed RNA polymerase subunit RPC12/RpoP